MLFVGTGLRAASPAGNTGFAAVGQAPETTPPPHRLSAAEILRRFDRNGDGRIDDQELAAAQDALVNAGLESVRPAPAARHPVAVLPGIGARRQLLRRFDRNGDGRIDAAEWARLGPVLRRRIQTALQQLRQYDKNGDGVIDDAEWAADSVQIRRWLAAGGPARPADRRAPAGAR